MFAHHKDEDFSNQFASLVEKAYSGLFELHGKDAWNLDSDELITFFRQSDQTSAVIGRRQAATFKVLASLAGHGDARESKAKKLTKGAATTKSAKAKETKKKAPSPPAQLETHNPLGGHQKHIEGPGFGLTVRVEINLPADGTKETYDNIFKSIKENLLGG